MSVTRAGADQCKVGAEEAAWLEPTRGTVMTEEVWQNLGLFFFSSRRRHPRSVSAFLLNRSSDLLLLLLLVAPCLNCLEAVKKPPPVAFKVMCLLPITIL